MGLLDRIFKRNRPVYAGWHYHACHTCEYSHWDFIEKRRRDAYCPFVHRHQDGKNDAEFQETYPVYVQELIKRRKYGCPEWKIAREIADDEMR